MSESSLSLLKIYTYMFVQKIMVLILNNIVMTQKGTFFLSISPLMY